VAAVVTQKLEIERELRRLNLELSLLQDQERTARDAQRSDALAQRLSRNQRLLEQRGVDAESVQKTNDRLVEVADRMRELKDAVNEGCTELAAAHPEEIDAEQIAATVKALFENDGKERHNHNVDDRMVSIHGIKETNLGEHYIANVTNLAPQYVIRDQPRLATMNDAFLEQLADDEIDAIYKRQSQSEVQQPTDATVSRFAAEQSVRKKTQVL
jgi:hypothetical protein